MKDIADRLISLMREKGIEAGPLAVKAGLTYDAVYKIITRQRKRPTHDTLKKLAAALDVPLSALTNDDADATHMSRPAFDSIHAGPTIYLPIFEFVKAGEGGCLVTESPIGYDQVALDRVKHDIEHFFLFRVSGNSMSGVGIMNQSLVLVHAQSDIEDNQIALVVLADGSNTVKRVRLLNEFLLLIPANPEFREQRYSRNEVHICGRVVRALTDF